MEDEQSGALAAGRPPSWLLLILTLLTMFTHNSSAICPARCRCNDDVLEVSCASTALEVVPIQLNPESRHINLSHNKIHKVHFTLSFYTNLITLDLSTNKIQTLGTFNFESQHLLKKLNLSNNDIDTLVKDTFKGLKSLQELDLSSNQLEEIAAGAFHDLRALVKLHLKHNRIISFEDSLLKHQTNLRILLIQDNQLLEIPTDNLALTPNLEHLSLTGNFIKSIELNSIPLLTCLKYLELDSNVISDIHRKAFEGTPSLEYLNLSDNNLTEIPTPQLSTLSNLTHLHLSCNFFQELLPVSFRGLFQLKSLHLNRMEYLTRIDFRTFVDNINLEKVWLDDNYKIATIPTRLFHGNPQLTHISMRNNMLTTIETTHFPLDQLHTLRIGGNPWNCNCSLLWLWKLAHEQLRRPVSNFTDKELNMDIDNILCEKPENFKEKLILEIPESHMRCSMSWLAAATGGVSAILLVAVIAIVVFYSGVMRRCTFSLRGEPKDPPPETAPCANGSALVFDDNSKYGVDRYVISTPMMINYNTIDDWDTFHNNGVDIYKQLGYNMKHQSRPHIVFV